MSTNAAFPIQPALTAVAIAYRNKRLIADDVLPRVPVASPDFKYLKHTLSEGFSLPDTKVGRRSAPNEVEFTATEAAASCIDYGLDDPVPNSDIDAAATIPGLDPVMKAVERTTELIQLDREVRAASLVFDANQYGSANKATLSGNSQWSDFANSDPITTILSAMDGMIMRPNIMVLGQAVFTKLRTHPKIAKAVLGNSGDVTIATRQAIAELFELEAIFVGEGFLNTAKKGQTPSMARVWGKHCALIYRDSLADASSGTTFGFTAQWGSRIAGSEYDSKIGLRGGQRVRVGESVKELVTANDLGYLFTNAVA